MNSDFDNAGVELLFLLRQQHSLYHQLKQMTERPGAAEEADSPEFVLKSINSRRKLIEKLHQLNEKLQLVNENWHVLSPRIGSENKDEARKMIGRIQQVEGNIIQSAPAEVTEKLPVSQTEKLKALFVD